MYGDMKMQKKIRKTNPVKKNMDKFHKPRTHRDKTKYNRTVDRNGPDQAWYRYPMDDDEEFEAGDSEQHDAT